MSGLPAGWSRLRLGEVIKIRNGYAFKSSDFGPSGTPVIRQSNLTGHNVDLTKCVCVPASVAANSSAFAVHKGDILIGMSGSIGEPSIYQGEEPALQNQRTGLIVFRETDSAHRAFIKYFLQHSEEAYIKKGKGIGVQNVSATDIEGIEILLPPLDEQRRIVIKLDEFLANTKQARDHLSHVRKLVPPGSLRPASPPAWSWLKQTT